jgi:hypothetical protein
VGVDLDPVAVGVEDLDAGEAAVVLPLGLGEAGGAEALAGGVDGGGVAEAEAEVDGAGRSGTGSASESASSEPSPSSRISRLPISKTVSVKPKCSA